MCVMTAQEAIDLVDQRRLTTNPGAMANLAAWWYNVLFLYTSATVLIAARLSPLILSQITETAIFDSWRKVLHGFDQYSVFGTPIRRLRNTLKLLFDTVPQQFSQIRQLPEERDRRRRISGPRHTTEAWTQGEAEESRQPAMSQPQGAPALDQDRLSTDSFDFTWDGSPSLFAAFDTNDMSWLTTVPFEI